MLVAHPRLRFEFVGLAPFAGLVLWSLALLAVRLAYSGSRTYGFLAWNLFLALVPLAASTLLRAAHERAASRAVQIGLFAVWLVFLPNAPYLLTDLFHLGAKPPVPLWFDLALLLSCSATGIALGFRSAGDVHEIVSAQRGKAVGWAFIVGVWFLCAYGIYLGRFLRWNSWDLLQEPLSIIGVGVDALRDPTAHPRLIGVTLIFGVLLSLAYLTARAHASWVATRATER